MDELINYLLLFGDLNQQQVQLVLSKCVKHEIKRDEFFQEAGKIPNKFAFLVSGVLKVSYYNNKGDEVTKYFLDENHFVVDLESYNQQKPSPEYIQAVTDCTYITLSREALKELSLTIADWDDILNKIISKALVEKVNKISMMMAEDATERYLNFFNRFPKLANRIPLSHLASYLGITQSSLSRIRRSVSG
jgi:CRP-like cAMP-binding protein